MASHSHLLLAVFEAPQNSPPIPCCCESMLGWLCADKRRHPSLLSGPRRSNKRIWHGTLNPEPLSLWLASVGELPLSLLINQEIFQLSFSLSNSISLELSPPTLSLSLAIALSFFASNSFEGIWLLWHHVCPSKQFLYIWLELLLVSILYSETARILLEWHHMWHWLG